MVRVESLVEFLDDIIDHCSAKYVFQHFFLTLNEMISFVFDQLELELGSCIKDEPDGIFKAP